MKPSWLLCFSVTLFAFTAPFSTGDIGKYIVGQKIEEAYYVSIRERVDTINNIPRHEYSLVFHDGWDAHEPFAKYNLDTLRNRAFRNYLVSHELHGLHNFYRGMPAIQFVNKQLGFMYGTGMGYAYYPYVYRTEDGGANWTLQTQKELGRMLMLDEKGFRMFNAQNGVIIWGNAGSDHPYSLTEDGGKSWSVHHINMDPGYRLSHTLFTETGVVLTYSTGGSDQVAGDVRVMKSTDYGKTFRELK